MARPGQPERGPVKSQRGIICVFARAPVAGAAKTRLIPVVGAGGAADLARAFLQDTWATMTALPWARVVLTTPGDTEAMPALDPGPEIWDQGPGDLGQRMECMMRRALAHAPWAMCVGTDSPGMPPAMLDAAHAALQRHDAVLGPAEDGGYYLIGLSRCPLPLLEDLPWSHGDTLARTHTRLVKRGLSVALIASWFDVDRPEDLPRLEGLLRAGKITAPRTSAVLRSPGVVG